MIGDLVEVPQQRAKLTARGAPKGTEIEAQSLKERQKAAFRGSLVGARGQGGTSGPSQPESVAVCNRHATSVRQEIGVSLGIGPVLCAT